MDEGDAAATSRSEHARGAKSAAPPWFPAGRDRDPLLLDGAVRRVPPRPRRGRARRQMHLAGGAVGVAAVALALAVRVMTGAPQPPSVLAPAAAPASTNDSGADRPAAPDRVTEAPPEPAADPAAGVPVLATAAEAGDPVAQHDLAVRYAAGDGVPQDYQRAVRWFEEAAHQGVSNAMYNLSVLYRDGLGVPADLAQAALWCRQAAERGHAEAMYNLGLAYARGSGVEGDLHEAVGWLQRAADAGIGRALFDLGHLYEAGVDGAPDLPSAAAWYRRSAARGDGDGAAALARVQALAAADGPVEVHGTKPPDGAGPPTAP